VKGYINSSGIFERAHQRREEVSAKISNADTDDDSSEDGVTTKSMVAAVL
jgi:hypothetical protein